MKKISILRQLSAIITNALGRKEVIDADTRRIMAQWLAEKGWNQKLNFDEVSAKLGLRKDQISLFVHHYYGQNFLSWRRKLRIEEAKRLLLEDKSIPAALVGEAVGITDKSNFRRQFKELTGCTPVEWRELKH